MSPALETPKAAPETNEPPKPTSGLLDHTTTPSTTAHWTPATALATLPTHERPSTIPPTSPIPFLHLLHRLKNTKREGWRRFGIAHGESISDHMYRMSLMTMVAPRALTSHLDIARCTRMALVHDMAELLVGDITPLDKMDKVEKSRREAETMDWLCDGMLGAVDGGVQGDELRALWREYEDSETAESKFVHDVDKIELVLQMVEYEKAHRGEVDLGEFVWVAGRIVLPECRAWVKELLAERDAFWEGVGREPENGRQSLHRMDLLKMWEGEEAKVVDGGSKEVNGS